MSQQDPQIDRAMPSPSPPRCVRGCGAAMLHDRELQCVAAFVPLERLLGLRLVSRRFHAAVTPLLHHTSADRIEEHRSTMPALPVRSYAAGRGNPRQPRAAPPRSSKPTATALDLSAETATVLEILLQRRDAYHDLVTTIGFSKRLSPLVGDEVEAAVAREAAILITSARREIRGLPPLPAFADPFSPNTQRCREQQLSFGPWALLRDLGAVPFDEEKFNDAVVAPLRLHGKIRPRAVQAPAPSEVLRFELILQRSTLRQRVGLLRHAYSRLLGRCANRRADMMAMYALVGVSVALAVFGATFLSTDVTSLWGSAPVLRPLPFVKATSNETAAVVAEYVTPFQSSPGLSPAGVVSFAVGVAATFGAKAFHRGLQLAAEVSTALVWQPCDAVVPHYGAPSSGITASSIIGGAVAASLGLALLRALHRKHSALLWRYDEDTDEHHAAVEHVHRYLAVGIRSAAAGGDEDQGIVDDAVDRAAPICMWPHHWIASHLAVLSVAVRDTLMFCEIGPAELHSTSVPTTDRAPVQSFPRSHKTTLRRCIAWVLSFRNVRSAHVALLAKTVFTSAMQRSIVPFFWRAASLAITLGVAPLTARILGAVVSYMGDGWVPTAVLSAALVSGTWWLSTDLTCKVVDSAFALVIPGAALMGGPALMAVVAAAFPRPAIDDSTESLWATDHGRSIVVFLVARTLLQVAIRVIARSMSPAYVAVDVANAHRPQPPSVLRACAVVAARKIIRQQADAPQRSPTEDQDTSEAHGDGSVDSGVARAEARAAAAAAVEKLSWLRSYGPLVMAGANELCGCVLESAVVLAGGGWVPGFAAHVALTFVGHLVNCAVLGPTLFDRS